MASERSIPQLKVHTSPETVFLIREYVCERDGPKWSSLVVIKVLKAVLKKQRHLSVML